MKASDELRALSLPNGYTRDVIIRAAAIIDRLERENRELKERCLGTSSTTSQHGSASEQSS